MESLLATNVLGPLLCDFLLCESLSREMLLYEFLLCDIPLSRANLLFELPLCMCVATITYVMPSSHWREAACLYVSHPR